MNFFKKADGAISVYLAIILSIMLILTGVLVDGARARVAETQVQSAVESAANSSLAEYNNILKEWFGLMALSDSNPDALEAEIANYLNKNLMTELGADKSTISGESWNYVKKFMTPDNEYEDVNFLDMFDYRIEDINAVPIYNLLENEVIRSQIVEYMKYRAPAALTEGFLQKMEVFKSFKKQSEVMSSKLEIDKGLNDIKNLQDKLSEAIERVNSFDATVAEEKLKAVSEKLATKVHMEKVYEDYKQKAEQLKADYDNFLNSEGYKTQKSSLEELLDNADTEKEKSEIRKDIEELQEPFRKNYEDAMKNAKQANNELSLIITEAVDLKKALEEYIKRFHGYNSEAKRFANSIKNKSGSIVKQIDNVNNIQLKDDASDFAEKVREETSVKRKQVSRESMDNLIEKFDNNLNVLGSTGEGEGLIYRLSVIDVKEINKDRSDLAAFGIDQYGGIYRHVYNYIVNVDDLTNNFINRYKKIGTDEFKIDKISKGDKKAEDPRDAANGLVNGKDNPLKALEDSKDHKDFKEKLKDLPSGVAKISSEEILKSFVAEDIGFVLDVIKDTEDESGEENEKDIDDLLDKMDFTDDNSDSPNDGLNLVNKLLNALQNGLESMRDELYVGEYAMGTFSNHLTDKGLYKAADGTSISEYDLRGRQRSEHKPYLYFDNEIEYILSGTSDDNLNVYGVIGKILLIRFALNTIHIYTDPEKSKQALYAATAIAGWTGFGVPIVHTLIMLSWSMAESVLDVKCLMSGKSVVIFKTKDTWVLSPTGGLAKIKDEIQNNLVDGVQRYAKKAVNYEIDKAEDVAYAATQKVFDMIHTKIDNVVNKVFKPIEDALSSADKTVKDNYGELTESLEKDLNSMENEQMNDVIKEIYRLAREEYTNVKGDIEKELTRPIEEVKEKIEKIKQDIYISIDRKLEPMKESLEKNISEVAKKSKEEINKYIDSFSLKSSGTTGSANSNSIKGSLLSLNYEEYLRLLLLTHNREEKMTRIQDLIQLRMMKMTGKDDFRLSDCNTFLRVKANVSMKYFFLTQQFVRKELKTEDRKRHNISVILYKGY